MTFYSFPPYPPIAAARLPLTLISLEDWAMITITGEDSEKYLLSLLTIDVSLMTNHLHLLAAHCDFKGKMWSSLRLFRRKHSLVLIKRRSLCDRLLTELKKYAVFSKVIIATDEEHVLLGVSGFLARTVLKELFSALPDVNFPLLNNDKTSILWFLHPEERFLLVTDATTAEYIMAVLRGRAQLNNSQQWLALNIEAGEPVIDIANSGRFIPLAVNLLALGGINFKKGCYIGQEIIARAHFRGANKRALWHLAGHANRVPEVGEDLELKIDNNWYRTGTVLAAVQLEDKRLILLAVMKNNMKTDSTLRVLNDTNTLSIQSLPYSILKNNE